MNESNRRPVRRANPQYQNTQNVQNMTPEQRKALKRAQMKKRRERFLRRRAADKLRYSVLSLLVLIPCFALVLIYIWFFPKSTVSEIENRNLATFPKFTLSSYFSGDFTEDVTDWFTDTVPYRDSLKNMGTKISSLFGIASKDTVTFVNADLNLEAKTEGSDFGSDAEDATAGTAGTTDGTVGDTTTGDATAADAAAADTAAEEAAQDPETDYTAEDAEFDESNGLLLVYQNDHWRCLSLYGGGSGDEYVDALNTLHSTLGDSVAIYSMPAPTATQYYLPANAASYSVDQVENMDEVNAKLDTGITYVNIDSAEKAHTDEDTYLRTDHHWAPLGAYYACQVFADAAGVPFADLSTYTAETNEGYVGTMYSFSNDARLLNDPEPFNYFIPNCNYNTYYYNTDFSYWYTGDLIQQTSVAGSYLMFMGSDSLICHVKTAVNNGRKLLMIKDSYGNAEVPFYTSSFEEIFVTDMRYFDCNLVNFIQDMGITDVLFTMCTYSVVGTNASGLSTLMTQNADQHYTVSSEETAVSSSAAATTTTTDTAAAADTTTAADTTATTDTATAAATGETAAAPAWNIVMSAQRQQAIMAAG